MALLRAHNIVKSYSLQSHNDTPVLRNVSVEIGRGEFVALIGPSGAGKSTLLHILGLLDTPDTGDVAWNFADTEYSASRLTTQQAASVRNKNIGFIFQFHHLLPEFNAIENVCIPAYIAKKNESETQKRAQELLDFLGLKDRMHHKPGELSGGEQQRVSVARALMNKPLVILADEPTGNLDTERSEELHQLFFDLKKEFNQTFVIVTHNEHLAARADKKFSMKDGLIVNY